MNKHPFTFEELKKAYDDAKKAFPCNCKLAKKYGGFCMRHQMIYLSKGEKEAVKELMELIATGKRVTE